MPKKAAKAEGDATDHKAVDAKPTEAGSPTVEKGKPTTPKLAQDIRASSSYLSFSRTLLLFLAVAAVVLAVLLSERTLTSTTAPTVGDKSHDRLDTPEQPPRSDAEKQTSATTETLPADVTVNPASNNSAASTRPPVQSAHTEAVADLNIDETTPLPPVVWMAPFFSGGGYCSEAISFVMALRKHTKLNIIHYADAYNTDFFRGLDDATQAALIELIKSNQKQTGSIVVCHSEPGAWHPPLYHTLPCPDPRAPEPAATVGRTMFETDRLPDGWVPRLNKMTAIWVPTTFHKKVFIAGHVIADKIAVVPEPVDVDFFNPETTQPYPLPSFKEGQFRFLSVFKWEERKGWRYLLHAYLTEFTQEDNAVLYILTNAYHTDSDFFSKIEKYVHELGLDMSKIPAIHVLPEGIPTKDMPSVYKAADVFVLPSRGEGWGRPHVEAMSMALPVIATDWSGPTEYLNDQNGYPLRINGLESIPTGPFKGHLWAQPSVAHLRELMRHVYNNREEARNKGLRARHDMVTKYCPECVNKIVMRELRIVQHRLLASSAKNNK